MTWRYLVGSQFSRSKHEILSSDYFPLTRYYPAGDSWLYDMQRFKGNRKIENVIDAGANTGQTAHMLTKYCKQAQIYCFEPISETFSILSQKYDTHKQVKCIQKALGSECGTSQIMLHENSELNTMVSNQPRISDLTGHLETISVDTVDHFCEHSNISYIDLLKMDVQGWELEILKGAKSLISENLIQFIYAEVGFRRADSDMQYFSELNTFMETSGYFLCGFYENFRWGDSKKYLGFSNVLYINPHFCKNI